ncbi:SH3 domain-containing protein [Streptomyces chattanoogensis]|uniref:SH3 domain-containing protein n=1 Tax=Streptomyces chattanoogensis TaxID=66876 RepID=UPI0005D9CC44|nr:hypothetical protein T261_1462 [Streptomyces lydicus]
MSKFTRRAAALGAGLALAAVLSPVAHADDHADARPSVTRAGYTELYAFENAPVYSKPNDSSQRLGTVRKGGPVRVWCSVKGPSGHIWYSIQDLAPGGHYVWSGHFISTPIKPC